MTFDHAEFSRKGGKSKSDKKRAAAQQNAAKAREARWPKTKKP